MTFTRNKSLLWALTLVVILACVPGVGGPAVPAVATLDPNAINTVIAGTAQAALTQTQAAIPSATPTVPTATPTKTFTPEPTATATVIFILSSPTPLVLPTIIAGGKQDYACQVISQKPANGTSFNPRDDFDAKWTVKNIGRREWDNNSVDYYYVKGDKLHKVDAYDLPKAVKVGETIEIIADMVAPKNQGSYATNWSLRIGTEDFCPLSLTIVVK